MTTPATRTGPATDEQAPARSRQRGDIQGMRAVAVVLVVLAHAGVPGLAGGFIGVDVFFVISGFLITGILAREVTSTGRVSILDFYARRGRRILPAATVTLVAVALASSVVYSAGHRQTALTDVTWAALFGANIRFGTAGTGYFDQDTFVSPVQHYWSLAVEEQFYLLWPLVILLVARGLYQRHAHSSERVQRANRRVAVRRSLTVLLLLSLLSFVWSVVQTGSSPNAAYFSTLTRFWELGVGSVLALSTQAVARLPEPVRAAMSWVGLAAIAVAAVTFDESTAVPGYAIALPVLGSAAVLAAGVTPVRGGAALLLDRAAPRRVGDISYSLYLWHWPLLILPAAYLGRPLTALESCLAVAAGFLAGEASYRWVETPLRHPSRHRAHPRRRSLVMWPAAIGAVLLAVGGTQLAASGQSSDVDRSVAGPPTLTPAQQRSKIVDAVSRSARSAAQSAPLPSGLVPDLTRLRGDVSNPREGCGADVDQTRHGVCTYGDPNSSRTIVAWGDSHLGMWLEPLSQEAKRQGYKILWFSKHACLPVRMTQLYDFKPYTSCDSYRAWAVSEIRRLRPQQVILSGYLAQPFVDPRNGGPVGPVRDGRLSPRGSELFRSGARAMLTELRRWSPQVTWIGDVQRLERGAPDCLGSRSATQGDCAESLSPEIRDRNATLRSLAKPTRTRFLDMTPYVCSGTTCPVVIGRTIVYRDDNHVTTTFARTLTPVIGQAITPGTIAPAPRPAPSRPSPSASPSPAS